MVNRSLFKNWILDVGGCWVQINQHSSYREIAAPAAPIEWKKPLTISTMNGVGICTKNMLAEI